MSLMLITHDFGVVAGMVERVNVMYRGEIVEAGPVDGIFAAPQHDYTKALLAAVPRLRPHGARIMTASPLLEVRDLSVTFPSHHGRKPVLAVRPSVASTSCRARRSGWSASPDRARPPPGARCCSCRRPAPARCGLLGQDLTTMPAAQAAPDAPTHAVRAAESLFEPASANDDRGDAGGAAEGAPFGAAEPDTRAGRRTAGTGEHGPGG